MNINTAYILVLLILTIFASVIYISNTFFTIISSISNNGTFVIRFEMDDNSLQAINFTSNGCETK